MEGKELAGARIPEISVIRCIATIQIVLFHLCAAEAPFAQTMVLWGREGVGLFFCHLGGGP